MESQLLQVGSETGILVVIHHDFGARREAGLDMWLNCQSLLNGLLREQPRSQHNRRIRSVRATRDRGDHDRTVLYFGNLAVHIHSGLARLFAEAREEILLHVFEVDAILRPLRARQRGSDLGEIEFERVRVNRIRSTWASGKFPAPS